MFWSIVRQRRCPNEVKIYILPVGTRTRRVYETRKWMKIWLKRKKKKRRISECCREKHCSFSLSHTHTRIKTYICIQNGRHPPTYTHTHTYIQSVERRIVSEPKQLQSPTVTWQTHPVPTIVFVYMYLYVYIYIYIHNIYNT